MSSSGDGQAAGNVIASCRGDGTDVDRGAFVRTTPTSSNFEPRCQCLARRRRAAAAASLAAQSYVSAGDERQNMGTRSVGSDIHGINNAFRGQPAGCTFNASVARTKDGGAS